LAPLASFLRKLEVPTVPIIMGILLGGHMEDSLRRSMVISGGDWTHLFNSSISIGLWVAGNRRAGRAAVLAQACQAAGAACDGFGGLR